MIKARRISQILFFALFVYLFLKAAFPYQSVIPADLFLRSDPLVAIITMITAREFLIGSFIFAVIVLLLTLFLGRFFCGWICPLGAILDLTDRFFKKNRKKVNPARRKFRLWKYSLLILVFFAAIFSLQFIWLFDPISLVTRTFTASIYPLSTFFFESIFYIVISIGLFQDALFSLYDSLRGIVLPLEPLYFRQSVIFIILFLSILLFGLITKRFWCRYL